MMCRKQKIVKTIEIYYGDSKKKVYKLTMLVLVLI